MNLPENLFGEKWAFVQLPYSAVREEISDFEEKFVFGATLDLDLLGIEVDENTLIPGLSVATSRAKPLAGKCVVSLLDHLLEQVSLLLKVVFDSEVYT